MQFCVVKLISFFQKWLTSSSWYYCATEMKGNGFARFFGVCVEVSLSSKAKDCWPRSPLFWWKLDVGLPTDKGIKACQKWLYLPYPWGGDEALSVTEHWMLDCRGHLTAALNKTVYKISTADPSAPLKTDSSWHAFSYASWGLRAASVYSSSQIFPESKAGLSWVHHGFAFKAGKNM